MAAADCGQYGEPPPPMLEMAWAVDYYGQPLVSGGVYDQSVKASNHMRVLKNIYDAFSSMVDYSGDQADWSRRYPGYHKIVSRVQRVRIENGNGS